MIQISESDLNKFFVGFELEYFSDLPIQKQKEIFEKVLHRKIFVPTIKSDGKKDGKYGKGSKTPISGVNDYSNPNDYKVSNITSFNPSTSKDSTNKEEMRIDLKKFRNFKPTADVYKLKYDHSGDEIKDKKIYVMFELVTGSIN